MLLTKTLITGIAFNLCGGVIALAAPPTVDLPISAITADVEGDNSAVFYGKKPWDSLLLGNDGTAATGGFRVWNLLDSNSDGSNVIGLLPELKTRTPGRTKVAEMVYDIGKRDYIISIAAPDSIIRAFDIKGVREIPSARQKVLGDWSALCTWRSPESGSQYFYLFGKKKAAQFIIRKHRGEVEILEVQTFDIPVEPDSCAVSPTEGTVYFAAEDKTIYNFQAEESMKAPKIDILGKVENDVTGLAVYVTSRSYYLMVAQESIIRVYSPKLELQGSLKITGSKDVEVKGLSIYQDSSPDYPAGLISYALESDDGQSFGTSSLEPVFKQLEIELNTKYDPRPAHGQRPPSPRRDQNGFENGDGSLSCFAGWKGRACSRVTCLNDCSGNGKCRGPNECKCRDSWSGPDCSFIQVEAKYETEANGGDGDDPAIWTPSESPDRSTIITTTKSEGDAGLSVFDLEGKLLQQVKAGEPNNVDVIYGFDAGNKTIDLAYAACRKDNTLCLHRITSKGLLESIPGGSQPTPPDYKVYGSCAYRSPNTGKQYLFVNSKTAEYLQYELKSSTDGTLSTTLVRSFMAGSGGQVEGCVTDEENGNIFIGEEPTGLWQYDAEPSGSNEGTIVARVGDGIISADVEGVTLVPGKTAKQGFIIVSCQGISAYAVFRRQAPYDHVMTFNIGSTADGSIDAVSNTDGVTAVGTKLNDDFPNGLLVVHDDANELAEGGTATEASFKLVSLADVLGHEYLKELELLNDVDESWHLEE